MSTIRILSLFIALLTIAPLAFALHADAPEVTSLPPAGGGANDAWVDARGDTMLAKIADLGARLAALEARVDAMDR